MAGSEKLPSNGEQHTDLVTGESQDHRNAVQVASQKLSRALTGHFRIRKSYSVFGIQSDTIRRSYPQTRSTKPIT